MMAKAEAIQLFVMLGAGTASHFSPRTARHLLQTRLQVLASLRQALPVFIVGHATSITQHVAIPVLAATDAAIARFDSTNAAFEIIVGTREVFHIITAHQMGTHVQKGLTKRFESLRKGLGGIEGPQITLKLFEPAIQPFAYGGVGDVFRGS